MKSTNSRNHNPDDVKKEIEKLGFYFFDIKDEDFKKIYSGICSKYNLIDKEGYKYHCRLQHILNNKFPNIVGNNNPYSLDNIKLWIIKNKKPYTLISKEFTGTRDYLEFECNDCHIHFQRNWDNISNGSGCRKCRYEKQRILQMRPKSKNKEMLTDYPDICKDWDNNNKYPINIISAKSSLKVKWKCHKCNYEWETSPSHRVKDNSGCPKCALKMSKGETIIYNYLKQNNIEFKKEATFKDCRDKNPLPFDFYLPKQNICIEYDGIQHYRPINFGNGLHTDIDSQFIITQKHDKIKNEYCRQNNIILIKISYKDKNHIDEILSSKLIS